MPTPIKPEHHTLSPTPHVPNSTLPIIVYRSVLPDTSPSGIAAAIEPNRWLTGGQWTTYGVAHFHSNTHECYAVIKGSSTYVLGRGPLDDETYGMDLDVSQGDVFVLPAGVSHYSKSSEGDYEFVGLYPEGLPKWDMNMCKASPEETQEKADFAANVPIPDHDPVYGLDGPLPRAWRAAVEGKV